MVTHGRSTVSVPPTHGAEDETTEGSGMDAKSYNGWSNYETWVTALWIDNEEGSQAWAHELAVECKGNQHERYDLAEGLKAELYDAMPDLGATLWADLLNAAWSEVDWYEIADNYLAGVEESENIHA